MVDDGLRCSQHRPHRLRIFTTSVTMSSPSIRPPSNKSILELIKSVFLTGLLIAFPAWLAILLLVKLLVHLEVLVKPIAVAMPEGVNHPWPWSVVAFLLVCFVIGLLFHTAIGKLVGRTIESAVLEKIPGYPSLRSIANQVSDFESEKGFKPALVEMEDGCLTPAFLIETHQNDFSTVFVPSVPTPMAGNILIMPTVRIHPVDVSVPVMMKCISKWGSGSGQILAAMGQLKFATGPHAGMQVESD